jgi:hypothetical protein
MPVNRRGCRLPFRSTSFFPRVCPFAFAFACFLLSIACGSTARADDTKRACVAASLDGQTLRKQDKLIEARDKLRTCASESCPEVVRSRCTRWLSDLDAEIPTVIVRVMDAAGNDVLDVDVAIDGHASKLGRPEVLDPGEHTVVVKRASGETKADKFLLVDGEHARILTVRLANASTPARAAEPPPSATRSEAHGGGVPIGAWILGAVGVGSLGSFVYFILEASSDYSKLSSVCSPNCKASDITPLTQDADVAYVSIGVGIAALAGAVTWALLPRGNAGAKASAAYLPALDVRTTPGGALVGLGVRF